MPTYLLFESDISQKISSNLSHFRDLMIALMQILSMNPNMPKQWLRLHKYYKRHSDNAKALFCLLYARSHEAKSSDFLDQEVVKFRELTGLMDLSIVGHGISHSDATDDEKEEAFTDLGTAIK